MLFSDKQDRKDVNCMPGTNLSTCASSSRSQKTSPVSGWTSNIEVALKTHSLLPLLDCILELKVGHVDFNLS